MVLAFQDKRFCFYCFINYLLLGYFNCVKMYNGDTKISSKSALALKIPYIPSNTP